MTTLAYLGPVALDMLGDFEPAKNGDPSEHGIPMRLSGTIRKPEAEQLKELVGNRHLRFDWAGRSGALQPIWIQNRPELLGFYLFERFDTSQNHLQQLKGWASFSLDCFAVHSHQVAITRSARLKDNDYTLTARSTVVQPFWGEDPDGEPFATPPGGTAIARDYDPRPGFDVRNPTTENRKLRIHIGVVTG